MRYTLDGMLPQNAFQKKLGSNRPATLEGGGGGIMGTVGSVVGGIGGGMIGGPAGAMIGSKLGGSLGGAIDGPQSSGGGGQRQASSGGGGGGGDGGGGGGYSGSTGGPGNLTADVVGGGATPISLAPTVQFGQQIPQAAKEGGLIGHNPQFYSEGGLSSMENQHVNGDGDGTSDSVPAMLADGEFVIPADVVAALGNGSNGAGSDVLSSFLSTIREHKQKHDTKELPPDSKGPLAYLTDAKRQTKA